MPNSVTPYAVSRFGSHRARPKIIAIYDGASGWRTPPLSAKLTRGTAEKLREEGFTIVRVKWRFATHEVHVRRYLGE